LIYWYDKCLNRYGDYVKKYITHVPLSNPCVLLTVNCLHSK
jgi:hypothetical protein